MNTSDAHTAEETLRGKRILITGGSTGIGRAIGNLLGSYGSRIFIFGRHRPELEDALRDIRKNGGDVDGVVADVALPEDVKRVFVEAKVFLGGIDILINNAGLAGEGLTEMKSDDWRYMVETNLTGFLACAKEAADQMKENGKGHIVLIGSMSTERPKGNSTVYVATKSGIKGFAKAFRQEVNKIGIKVSLIEPGATGSDMQEETPEEQRALIKNQEMLRAEDIAVAVHYVLTQPARCAVVSLQIDPQLQPS